MNCKKCDGLAQGFKCDVCGAVSSAHDEGHGCGGQHCMPMCAPCGEAEAKCSC